MKYLPLIRLLINRELTLRYKRSVIGIGWTLLNPVLTSAVLWYVFSFVFASRLPNGQQFGPYLMAGFLLNTFFGQGLMQSADSIASNGGVLTKIFVPPQVFAISSALAGLTNFFIGMLPLAVVCYISGQPLAWTLPLVLVVGILLALLVAGLGLSLSILFIRFDDSRNIVAVLLLDASKFNDFGMTCTSDITIRLLLLLLHMYQLNNLLLYFLPRQLLLNQVVLRFVLLFCQVLFLL
jgi:ABC-type polysaccharide/polyol phosphate export permease